MANEDLPALFSDGEPRCAVLEAGRNWHHSAQFNCGRVKSKIHAVIAEARAYLSLKGYIRHGREALAVARHLLKVFYRVLTTGRPYQAPARAGSYRY